MNKSILKKYNINVLEVLKSLRNIDHWFFFNHKDIIESKKWIQYQVRCPFHDDGSPSMWINTEYNSYNCFVCRERVWESKYLSKDKSIWHWNFIQFLKVFYEFILKKEVTSKEIADLVKIRSEERNKFISEIERKQSFTWRTIKKYIKAKEENNLRYTLLDDIKYNWKEDYLKSRLLKYNDISNKDYEETKKHFLLHFLEDWSIIFPVIKNYKFIWIYWRKNQKETSWKYFNLISFKKTNIIYNWDFVRENETILLVEGPLNAIRLWSLWYKNVVSFFWAIPYRSQLELLKEKMKIFIWFDNDKSWQEWIKKIREELDQVVEIYNLKSNEKKDSFDYSKEEIKKLFSNFKRIW